MKRQEIKSWNSLHGIYLRYVLCLLNIIKQQQQQYTNNTTIIHKMNEMNNGFDVSVLHLTCVMMN